MKHSIKLLLFFFTIFLVKSVSSQEIYTLHVPPAVVANAGEEVNVLPTDSVVIGGIPTANFGIAPYTYNWMPSLFVDTAYLSNPLSFPDTTTGFTVVVTDSHGCTDTSQVTVRTPETQTVVLPGGWSIFSTYLQPLDIGIDSIVEPILQNLIIIKDWNGQVYWPLYGVNLIGDIFSGQGFQIKMNISDTLTISGFELRPEVTPIIIPTDWSILGYIRTTPAPITTMLAPIITNLTLVKDFMGQAYWPLYGVDLIGNMLPGMGYQVNMEATDTLLYPSNETVFTKKIINILPISHFQNIAPTGNNMTVGIPLSAWTIKPNIGDEVAVFNAFDEILGSAVFQNQNMAIAVWGIDELDKKMTGLEINEVFNFKIWDRISNTESDIEITNWIEGDNTYAENKIAVAGKVHVNLIENDKVILFQNTPNPFSETTFISFYLPHKTKVELSVYSIQGIKTIYLIQNNEMEKGIHKIKYSAGELSAGTYYYRLTTPDFTDTKVLNLTK